MKKILVTGCSGFIGKHLVLYLLSHGYEVVGIDIKPTTIQKDKFYFEICDIRDKDCLCSTVERHMPDAVLHLAARTDLDGVDLTAYSANTIGVENLIKAVQETKSIQRCIYTSSQLVCKVGFVPQDEYEYCPDTFYGQSKVITEKNVRECDGGGCEWCITRPTTIWGPGMSPHYQRFFRLISTGRYFNVGNRSLDKSYGYVGNTVYQYLKLLLAPEEEISRKTFYLADYSPLSLRSWTKMLQTEMDAPSIPTVPEGLVKAAARLGDALNSIGFHSFPYNSFRLRNVLTEYQFNLSSTEKICGPLPFSAEDGVKATVCWLKEDGIIN